MHSLAGCLPAGITYRLYDSRNYPQITLLVPMCALPSLPAPVPSSVYLRPDNNRSASNAREIPFSLSVSNLLELENEIPANRDGIEYLTGCTLHLSQHLASFKRASDIISYWMKHVSVLLCARVFAPAHASNARVPLPRMRLMRARLTRMSLAQKYASRFDLTMNKNSDIEKLIGNASFGSGHYVREPFSVY